jgi:hypothetical protein
MSAFTWEGARTGRDVKYYSPVEQWNEGAQELTVVKQSFVLLLGTPEETLAANTYQAICGLETRSVTCYLLLIFKSYCPIFI